MTIHSPIHLWTFTNGVEDRRIEHFIIDFVLINFVINEIHIDPKICNF